MKQSVMHGVYSSYLNIVQLHQGPHQDPHRGPHKDPHQGLSQNLLECHTLSCLLLVVAAKCFLEVMMDTELYGCRYLFDYMVEATAQFM